MCCKKKVRIARNARRILRGNDKILYCRGVALDPPSAFPTQPSSAVRWKSGRASGIALLGHGFESPTMSEILPLSPRRDGISKTNKPLT